MLLVRLLAVFELSVVKPKLNEFNTYQLEYLSISYRSTTKLAKPKQWLEK